jgi:hypothetical protein
MHRAALEYWCTFFVQVLKRDKSEAKRVLEECRAVLKAPAPDKFRLPRFTRFAEYSSARENLKGSASPGESALSAFAILQELDVFECGEQK